ncbi:LapA family protein [Paenibacillus marinisediminis]
MLFKKSQPQDSSTTPVRMQWTLIAALVFALIIAIFAVINVNPVPVNLLFGTFDVPLILLILGCTLLGAVIVGSYSIYIQYRTQRKVKLLETQLSQVISETGYIFPIVETVSQSDQSSNSQDKTV